MKIEVHTRVDVDFTKKFPRIFVNIERLKMKKILKLLPEKLSYTYHHLNEHLNLKLSMKIIFIENSKIAQNPNQLTEPSS